jgi:DNA polymerase-1
LRSLFIASPGQRFIKWDQSAHEVRGIAYYSQDKTLLKLLADGLDPHQYVADLLKTDRATGKTTVFASVYGAGIKKLMGVTGKSAEEVKRLLAEIEGVFPALRAWKASVIKQVYNPGYVETPYGRRRHFWLVTEKNAHKQERVAVNYVVQSLCGDIALDGAIQVFEELELPPLLFVHDSNVVEVREDLVDGTVDNIKGILDGLFPNDVVKFKADVWTGGEWK